MKNWAKELAAKNFNTIEGIYLHHIHWGDGSVETNMSFLVKGFPDEYYYINKFGNLNDGKYEYSPYEKL